jgi:flagellar assembly factor FliW
MADEGKKDNTAADVKQLVIKSTRFKEFSVPADSVIIFPSGLIGFPRAQRFVMIEHKLPFSWLHSVEDPSLAFVVVNGAEFGDEYAIEPPFGDKDIDLQPDDEYAVLVIVTVRGDPKLTTANLKAPLFVNIRNRRGVQVIYDNPKFSTRQPLWKEGQEPKE